MRLFYRANAKETRAEMEESVYLHTTMIHVSVNVNQMEVGSVVANTARMLSVSSLSTSFNVNIINITL